MTPDTEAAIALGHAIRAGDLAGVRRLFAQHPDLASAINDAIPGEPFGATPLLAVPRDQPELFDFLLSQGADINQKSHWWAGGFGVLDDQNAPVDFLVARGASVDAYAASRHGMMPRLQALVAADPALVHARGGDGQTPLHVAASVEIAAFLLDHGAKIDALDVDHESTAAQYLVRERPAVARYLMSRGAHADLLLAAALGDIDRVQQHLDADPASIRMTVSDEWFPKRDPRAGGSIYIWTLGGHRTAHLIAQEFGHTDVLQLLLAHSPDDLRLMVACETGDDESIRALLTAHPDLPRTLSPEQARRITLAAEGNRAAPVRRMLAAGWPVDVRGAHGGTALHWAAWHGNAAMVREILPHVPDITVLTDLDGQSALGWALHGSLHSWHRGRGNYPAVIAALLQAGVKRPAADAAIEASADALAALRETAQTRSTDR